VDVFYGSVVGLLLGSGAKEVWVSKSARAARILAGQEGLLFGEQEGLPPEGFHYGTSLQPAGININGHSCILWAPPLAQALLDQGKGTLVAQFRNAKAAVDRAVRDKIDTLVAVPQDRFEPSLANTVAAGFLAKRLGQAYGKQGGLADGARLATTLLKSFPDPQEALFQSEMGQQLYRTGHTEDLALASLVSVEEVVPVLVGIEVLPAKIHGLSKDHPAYCFVAG